MRRIFLMIFFIMLICLSNSVVMAKGIDLSFFLGMKDGSDPSEGVIVSFTVEEKGEATKVFEQHWAEKKKWSEQFIVELNKWSGKAITLNLTTDPGLLRNTGWDWILIGDAKITAGGDLFYDIGQTVAESKAAVTILVDGDKAEKALAFGANCSPDPGPVGGQAKPKSFMQHPPWDGKVGNTISRYQMQLPAGYKFSVEANGKLATAWGYLKTE